MIYFIFFNELNIFFTAQIHPEISSAENSIYEWSSIVFIIPPNMIKYVQAKHSYTRKFLSTQEIYKAELSGKEQLYSCKYTIVADEWIGLRFVVAGAKDAFAIFDDAAVIRD